MHFNKNTVCVCVWSRVLLLSPRLHDRAAVVMLVFVILEGYTFKKMSAVLAMLFKQLITSRANHKNERN